ncbi:MAG: ABC transporter ATP-binding protein [Candidatus Dadabacteria bacterium]|nr:MAG: ABC transporter ATP-binding protein [Candidatus Dadabacteria bacterium]
MTTETILSVESLSFAVGDLQILNDVHLHVLEGETVGIIGPNGSGKTTLFNCLSGFNSPQKGSIALKGRDISPYEPHKRAIAGLGRVFQNFGIFREMTVGENIILALESRQPIRSTFFPWSKQNRKNVATAREYLKQVGLEDKFGDKAGSLSGGQMRLLEIIRTLAFGAELFLLDEPTAGVAPKLKNNVASLIVKLQELGKTVLIIEHDLNFIQKFCTRIIVLDQGRVVLDDAPEKVRESRLLQEIYFGNASE